MATWEEIESEAPALAGRAREFLDAHVHKTLATIRRDGSPRISGTETKIAEGELFFGSMWKSLKALDLRRDPRFAIHSGSIDPPEWPGDAKLAGKVEEVDDPELIARVYDSHPGKFHMFRADITELVVVSLNDDRSAMVIESWHPGRGVKRMER